MSLTFLQKGDQKCDQNTDVKEDILKKNITCFYCSMGDFYF